MSTKNQYTAGSYDQEDSYEQMGTELSSTSTLAHELKKMRRELKKWRRKQEQRQEREEQIRLMKRVLLELSANRNGGAFDLDPALGLAAMQLRLESSGHRKKKAAIF